MRKVRERDVKVNPERLFKGWKVFEVTKNGCIQNIFGKPYTVPEDMWIHEWVYRLDTHKAMRMKVPFGFHVCRFRRGALNWMKFLLEIFPEGSKFTLRRVKALGIVRKGKVLVSSDGCKVAWVLVATQIKVKRG